VGVDDASNDFFLLMQVMPLDEVVKFVCMLSKLSQPHVFLLDLDIHRFELYHGLVHRVYS
jgi:hypothetical protein